MICKIRDILSELFKKTQNAFYGLLRARRVGVWRGKGGEKLKVVV